MDEAAEIAKGLAPKWRLERSVMARKVRWADCKIFARSQLPDVLPSEVDAVAFCLFHRLYPGAEDNG